MSNTDTAAKITHYLVELRQRLLICMLAYGVLFSINYYYADNLYATLILPLGKYWLHPQLIATNIATVWLMPLKLAATMAWLFGMPFFLYQLWIYVAPALYIKERKTVWKLLVSSVLLFYLGMAFAYGIVLPMLYHLMLQYAPANVKVMPEMTNYFGTTLQFMWVFGFLFQIPIVMLVLSKILNWPIDRLKRLRPYVVVSAFILGMLVAPPDVVSQTLVALPLWGLYEIGLMICRIVCPR